ncbi:MAG: GNAT family N-acetyltransferase [Bdellovibrionota bacterium]
MLDLKTIPYGSPDYERTVSLRHEVLRKPLGLEFDQAFLAQEKDPAHTHVAAFDGTSLVGCLILTDAGGGSLKMRQVAVAANQQGKGVGRALVEFSEKFGHERGFREMVLNARETAVPFYLALDYEPVGETFTEVGIPHRKMRKTF